MEIMLCLTCPMEATAKFQVLDMFTKNAIRSNKNLCKETECSREILRNPLKS